MIRKTITIALFTFLGLLGTSVVFLASYENEFHQLLRLRQESQPTLAEQTAKAKEIAAKVLRRYEGTDHLSFRVESVYYWCKEGDWKTRLPLEWWPQQRSVASVEVAMTPQSLRTHIRVQGRPLYTYLMNGGTYYEFKWPWNGIPGQRTEYPADPRNTRLCRGVDPELLCETGMYRGTWVGVGARQPSAFRRFMERGVWIDTVSVRGQSCDLVFVDDEDETPDENFPRRCDAFCVNQEGLVVRWILMLSATKRKDYDWVFLTKNYLDFNTARIPQATFLPSNALLEEAKGWQTFSDTESWALLQTELHEPTTAPSGE